MTLKQVTDNALEAAPVLRHFELDWLSCILGFAAGWLLCSILAMWAEWVHSKTK